MELKRGGHERTTGERPQSAHQESAEVPEHRRNYHPAYIAEYPSFSLSILHSDVQS